MPLSFHEYLPMPHQQKTKREKGNNNGFISQVVGEFATPYLPLGIPSFRIKFFLFRTQGNQTPNVAFLKRLSTYDPVITKRV